MKRSTMRRQRTRPDPVTGEVYIAVMARDDGCVAVKLGEPAADCRGRLTLDHVKDQPRMGKRAPSDPAHLVSICEWHHLYGWATSHRPELRTYLQGVNG
jgi:hypothetical protein